MDDARLINQKQSSNKYGNCEVCGKYCNEVYHLTHPYGLFGHKECLEKVWTVQKNKSKTNSDESV